MRLCQYHMCICYCYLYWHPCYHLFDFGCSFVVSWRLLCALGQLLGVMLRHALYLLLRSYLYKFMFMSMCACSCKSMYACNYVYVCIYTCINACLSTNASSLSPRFLLCLFPGFLIGTIFDFLLVPPMSRSLCFFVCSKRAARKIRWWKWWWLEERREVSKLMINKIEDYQQSNALDHDSDYIGQFMKNE